MIRGRTINLFNPSNLEDIRDLSYPQEGILFDSLNHQNTNIYLPSLTIRLAGELDCKAFELAWAHVCETNDMLRTVFRWNELSNPVQVLMRKYCVPLYFMGFEGEETVAKSEIQIIDLECCPVVIILEKLEEREYTIRIDWHHIVYDGWSNAILLREFFAAYFIYSHGLEPEMEKKTSYQTFITFNRGQKKEEQIVYWKKYMRGYKPKTPLPCRQPITVQQPNVACFHRVFIDEETAKQISHSVTGKGCTMAQIIYLAWAVLLHKYSGEYDIVFGTVVSGRSGDFPKADRMVGLFVNTLPLRMRFDSATDLDSLFYAIKSDISERTAYEHTAPMILRRSCGDMGLMDSLYDSLVVVENYSIDSDTLAGSEDLRVVSYEFCETVNYHLALAYLPLDQSLTFQYNSLLFTKEFMVELADKYISIIRQLVELPGNRTVDDVVLHTDAVEKLPSANAGDIDFDFMSVYYDGK